MLHAHNALALWARIALALAVSLTMGSCGPGQEEGPSQPTPPQARPQELPEPMHEAVELSSLAEAVEIRRTSYGVPHILGETLSAGAYGLAWVMMEDYGEDVPRQLLEANGLWAAVEGRDALDESFGNRMAHDYALQVFSRLDLDVQAVYEGFAAGVNDFIRLHAATLPLWARPEFTPQNILAKDVSVWDQGAVRSLLRTRRASEGDAQSRDEGDARSRDQGVVRETEQSPGSREGGPGKPDQVREREERDPDIGSNAWAFAPERTSSGHAILLRNPHLSFTSGYYEAHMTVPGVLDFYGDFRLGGPFGIIGGFNDRLGWSTTNNYGDPDQVYALLKDPRDPGAYLFDGAPVPIEIRTINVPFLQADTLARATRSFQFTPLGPVLLDSGDTLFVLKTPTLEQYRIGEQWLRMMQARNLEEWKEAMRIRAKYSSNFTYADADGNIFFVWNASVPDLPHPPSDGEPVFAAGQQDVWTRLHPWDSLPQLLNPRGGYLQNANDPPYYTNLNEPLRPEDFPANFPEPRLRLRSQLSLELVHNDHVFSLEDVVELKHSMRMLLADRVKDDLLRILREEELSEETARAVQRLEDWDNQAARDRRGAALFHLWASRYSTLTDSDEEYRVPWSPDDPTGTPRGLGSEAAASAAFHWALAEAESRFGSWDVTWGEAHRIRAGALDLPVGGCPSDLGCFRVIGYAVDEDGRYRARRGDAWVLAVEFGETPRAYSVLLYGNSNQEESPWFYNQARMFANNRMKTVAYSETDISNDLVERYRPGQNRKD